MTPPRIHDALVVGGGPAGLAAALSLGRIGLDVALAAPPHQPAYQSGGAARDRRTAALFGGSVELLRNLGVWERLSAASEPLIAIRIIDDTGGLLKAPEVTFKASEAGLDAFGYNVPNAVLVDAMMAAACLPGSGVDVIETAGVQSLECGTHQVSAITREGRTLTSRLVAAADGRTSTCRLAAGIETSSWTYPQSAVVCSFEHTRPHRNVSTEFHRSAGPFTVVPMPGQSSSLVWVETPDEAQRLAALDDTAMISAIEHRLQGLLGNVRAITPRAAFPLSGLTAKTFGQNRVALIGEAGHVIPPIGAQGLNLGLRDGAVLADCVAEACKSSSDIGGPQVMTAYANARRADIASRIWTIDLLNRSLISELAPIQLARGAGLYALQSIGPLRRFLLREGIQPSHATPFLMVPGGLEQLRSAVAGRKQALA
jgi:2-octaprenyl-6-methoxyphenol hydroxylase